MRRHGPVVLVAVVVVAVVVVVSVVPKNNNTSVRVAMRLTNNHDYITGPEIRSIWQ